VTFSATVQRGQGFSGRAPKGERGLTFLTYLEDRSCLQGLFYGFNLL